MIRKKLAMHMRKYPKRFGNDSAGDPWGQETPSESVSACMRGSGALGVYVALRCMLVVCAMMCA